MWLSIASKDEWLNIAQIFQPVHDKTTKIQDYSHFLRYLAEIRLKALVLRIGMNSVNQLLVK